MDHTCNRSSSTIIYIGHCAGDGAGHGNTAKNRNDDIRRALGD